MAERVIDSEFNLYTEKPWSKRAAMTPRKTYSSVSKIIYKRKKHVFTVEDLERISNNILTKDTEFKKEDLSIWQKLLNFLRNRTINLMRQLLSGIQMDWIAESLYNFIHDFGAMIFDNPRLDAETRARLYQIWVDFLEAVRVALAKLTQ